MEFTCHWPKSWEWTLKDMPLDIVCKKKLLFFFENPAPQTAFDSGHAGLLVFSGCSPTQLQGSSIYESPFADGFCHCDRSSCHLWVDFASPRVDTVGFENVRDLFRCSSICRLHLTELGPYPRASADDSSRREKQSEDVCAKISSKDIGPEA